MRNAVCKFPTEEITEARRHIECSRQTLCARCALVVATCAARFLSRSVWHRTADHPSQLPRRRCVDADAPVTHANHTDRDRLRRQKARALPKEAAARIMRGNRGQRIHAGHQAQAAGRSGCTVCRRSRRRRDLDHHLDGPVRGARGVLAPGDGRGPAPLRSRVPAQRVRLPAAGAAAGLPRAIPAALRAARPLRPARCRVAAVDAGLVLCHFPDPDRRGHRHQLPGAAVRHAGGRVPAGRGGAHPALDGAGCGLSRRHDHPAPERARRWAWGRYVRWCRPCRPG